MTTNALPPGWTEHTDPSGKIYYFNASTNQSRWDKPALTSSLAQRALDDSPWKEFDDEGSGKKYYYNTDTKETVWDMPQEYQVLLERVSAEIKASLFNNGPQALAGPTVMEFKTKDDAEDCFMDMLEEFNVDATWEWETVIRKCHLHRMYKALKTVTERKEVFERYVADKKQRDESEMEQKYINSKKVLLKLFTNIKFDSKTTFDKMLSLLAENEEFQATEPTCRKKIFEEHMETVIKMENLNARTLRKTQLEKFKKLLKQLAITPSSSWKEAQVVFLPAIEKDPDLNGMDKMDILMWFEDYISTLDSSIRKDRHARIAADTRNERHCREKFLDLLHELKKSKNLHINCKWKEVYPIFKDDERFLQMLGTRGSTAMELFRDEIMILEDQYLPVRRIVMDTTRASSFKVTNVTTFSEFMSYFKNDFARLSVDHVKLGFDELVYKFNSKLKEEKRYQEKKLRKKMDAFKSVLKHLSKPISASDTWLSIRERSKGEEFNALDEDKRIEVFEKEKTEGKKKRQRSGSRDSSTSDLKFKKGRGMSSEEDGELPEV